MSPVTRLRTLYVTAFVTHAISAFLLLRENPNFAIASPIWLALIFTFGPLVCVFTLSWTARFLLQISLLFQLSLAAAGDSLRVPVALGLSLVGFFVSVVILALIFRSPTKQLFIRHRPDPDASIL